MELCDMHLHSCYSDGAHTPAELADLAAAAGLRAVALTDHNTTEGWNEMRKACEGRIGFCPGVEFSTEFEGKELHLVGLFPSADGTDDVNAVLGEQRRLKEEANTLTLESLEKAGYPVSYEDFDLHTAVKNRNRNHIADYLIMKKIVSDRNEAFNGLLSDDSEYYHAGRKPGFTDTVGMINRAGGISVWAHPFFDVKSEKRIEEILMTARDAGLDGVEAYYSTFTHSMTSFILEMCGKYGLLPGGGSDFHGLRVKKNLYLGRGYGDLRVPYVCWEDLMALAERK